MNRSRATFPLIVVGWSIFVRLREAPPDDADFALMHAPRTLRSRTASTALSARVYGCSGGLRSTCAGRLPPGAVSSAFPRASASRDAPTTRSTKPPLAVRLLFCRLRYG